MEKELTPTFVIFCIHICSEAHIHCRRHLYVCFQYFCACRCKLIRMNSVVVNWVILTPQLSYRLNSYRAAFIYMYRTDL